MSFVKRILHTHPVQKFLYQNGYLTQLDAIRINGLKNLEPGERTFINNQIKDLLNVNTWSDINDASKKVDILDKTLKKAFSKLEPEAREKTLSFLNNLGAVGYEPAGSVLKKLYPNPFQPYSFLADNYWAADKARREIRVEIERDGYVLIAPDRTSKREIKVVNDVLDELNIPELWTTWADHLNTFANIWLDVDKNLMRGIGPEKIKMLLPEKVVPEYDRYQENIIAWKYITMGKEFIYPLDSLDHIQTYSMRSFQLGSPSLTSLIVEIEADMHATIFNNTVMQKGGLIKGVLSIAAADPTNVINEQSYIDYADKIQEMINKKFSGIRGGGQILAMYGIDNYFDMNKIKEIDGIYQATSDRTAARVAMMFGVSPERLGINNYSQYKNNALVTDSIALSLDNNQYFLTGIVADYINNKILKERLGIENIIIEPSGEFGSISTAAAQFAQLIAQAQCRLMTVDEFRVKCLHWQPLGSPDGDEYIGNFLEKAIDQKSMQVAKSLGPAVLNYAFGNKSLIKHKPRVIRSFY